MSLAPILAVDLGVRPAAVIIAGTWECPVRLDVRRFTRWGKELFQQIVEWRERWPNLECWCESTFSGARWNRDTGRRQEEMVSDLAGLVGMVYRVEALGVGDPVVGWQKLGSPALGKGPVGEHVRDACGVALAALSRSRSGTPLYQFTTSWLAAHREDRSPQRTRRSGRGR